MGGGSSNSEKLGQEKVFANLEELRAYLYADGNNPTKCKKLLELCPLAFKKGFK